MEILHVNDELDYRRVNDAIETPHGDGAPGSLDDDDEQEHALDMERQWVLQQAHELHCKLVHV